MSGVFLTKAQLRAALQLASGSEQRIVHLSQEGEAVWADVYRASDDEILKQTWIYQDGKKS